MSSLFISPRPVTDSLDPHLQQAWRWEQQLGPLFIRHSRCDSAEDWHPACDPHQDLHLLLVGRVALEPTQWQQAESIDFNGGKACRWLLQQWQELPAEQFALSLNGNFGVVVIDGRKQQIHLFTDRCGATPFFIGNTDYITATSVPGLTTDGLLMGTRCDPLAQQLAELGHPPTLDKVSLAETLVSGSCRAPRTYYEQISELPAASHLQWTFSGKLLSQRSYWQPQKTRDSEREDDDLLATELASALQRAMTRRQRGRSGLLLSGGADSRALLFASSHPQQLTTATFFDQHNAELRVATQLAAAAGASHLPMQRDFEHYGQAAKSVVAMTDGMWCIKDVHYHGFAAQLHAQHWDALLTGCYADYLLKGLAYNTRPRRLLGRATPLQQLSGYAPEFYQPFARISPAWQARVLHRITPPPEVTNTALSDPSALEDWRVRPLSREPDAMGRLYLLRAMPWEPIFLDNDILRCHERLSPSQKLNSRVFRLAVHKIVSGKADHIPNNNDGVALNASDSRRLLKFVQLRLQRKLCKLLQRLRRRSTHRPALGTQGSWPDFSTYIRTSPVIAELWQQPEPADQALLSDLLGYDPWQISLQSWGCDERIDLFLRLLTVKIWLQHSCKAQKSVAITQP